ncbi:hypothetical protein D8992_09095, partial [Campylobacter coli]|nr:hypothetical protein [Campylobacter coli]EAL8166146.1 hypothetical protein [Campylobacter coli]
CFLNDLKKQKIILYFSRAKIQRENYSKTIFILIYFFCFFTYLYSKIFINFSIKKYSKSKPTKRQKIVLIKH